MRLLIKLTMLLVARVGSGGGGAPGGTDALLIGGSDVLLIGGADQFLI